MNSKRHVCFIQYSLIGGGAERKVCTLANFFAAHGYEVEIGLFARNIVAYDLDERVKLSFIDRRSYRYKNRFEKFRYRMERAMIRAFLIFPLFCAEKLLSVFHIKPFGKLNSEKVKKHFDKKHNYLQPIRNYIYSRPDAVFITMMVQSFNEIMGIIEEDVRSGKIKNPYLVMECSNPTVGLDSTEEDDRKRNRYYPLAARVVAMTQGIIDYYNEEIRRLGVVIPNPIRNDLPAAYDGGARKHIVVSFCRLNHAKNLPLLIRAFAKFHPAFPDYRLEIYGKGELEDELNRQIQELGLSDCAHIYDFDPHIHEKIKDRMMYVSSSAYEGFPNSVLEALALGMPVISTDCDFGPRDMIEDGVNGLLVPVDDAEAMSAAMKRIAGDESFAAKLGNEARKVREKYDVDLIGRKWLDLIEEVAKERGLQ